MVGLRLVRFTVGLVRFALGHGRVELGLVRFTLGLTRSVLEQVLFRLGLGQIKVDTYMETSRVLLYD